MLIGYQELYKYFIPKLDVEKAPKNISSHDLSSNAIVAYKSFRKHNEKDIKQIYEFSLKYSSPNITKENKKIVFHSPFFEYTTFYIATINIIRMKQQIEKEGLEGKINIMIEQIWSKNKEFQDKVFSKTPLELYYDILFRTKYHFFNPYKEIEFYEETVIEEQKEFGIKINMLLEKIFSEKKINYEKIYFWFLETMYSNIIDSDNEEQISLELKRELKILSNKKIT